MFKSIGFPELLLILVIIVIFFGVGKLPQVGAQMGKAIRAFKRSQSGEDKEEETPAIAGAKVTRSKRTVTTKAKP
jgi:sec-independent protein translocase protein TatA